MKAKSLILLTLIILFSALPFFAQRAEISKEDFLQRFNAMKTRTESTPRQIKYIFEHWSKDKKIKPELQEATISVIPPNKVHYVTKFSSIDIETIYIDDTEYEKIKGVWEKKNFSKQDIINNFITLAPERPEKVKCYVTENVTVNNQLTNLLEWIFTEEFQIENKETDLMENHTISYEIKYWVNPDDLLVKSERLDINTRPETSNFRFLRDYNYDKNLRIEAPIR